MGPIVYCSAYDAKLEPAWVAIERSGHTGRQNWGAV